MTGIQLFLSRLLKPVSNRILLLIFIANFFYDDGHAFLYKRLIYSTFIYLSVYKIFTFYFSGRVNQSHLRMPSFYRPHLALLLVFIVINLVTDFLNPAFNLITLINNPYALLCVTPVFLFVVGAHLADLEQTFNLLLVICILFPFAWAINIPGSVPHYQAFIASHAILPFFILASVRMKGKLFSWIIILLAIAFGFTSGDRIVLLNIFVFFGLFISLKKVKSSTCLKVGTILFFGLAMYLVLTNLEGLLQLFKDLIGKGDFDSDDTRSFLYKEFFDDFKSHELTTGRGFLGTYFSPYFLELQKNLDDSGDFYQRYSVEVGFLELLLKGGFVFYTLYTLPLWFVSIKAIIRHSQMKVAFYFGIYTLAQLLLMFFENIPYFSFQFALLYFTAGVTYRAMVYDKARLKRFNPRPMLFS